MAMLTIGSNQNKQIEAFTHTLTQTLSLAQEEALMQPTTLSLRLSPTQFGFYEYRQKEKNQEQGWHPLENRDLGLQTIPKGIQLSLQMNDKLHSISYEEAAPFIYISPNGNLTPFRLLIGPKNKGPRYEIIGQVDGSLISREYKS